jgi:hypothetical protein
VLQQDFLRLQGVGGVGRIDNDGMAADTGKTLDVFLDVKLVGAAVAAADDDDVHLGDVDHRHRIVDGRMHDVDGAGRQPVALAFRAVGELKFDLQAMPGEKTPIDRHIKRQRARGRECVDVQQDELRSRRGRRERTKSEQQRHGPAERSPV